MFKWPDGKIITGNWVAGKLEGEGELDIKGKKYKAEWKDGVRVRWIKENKGSDLKINFF